MIRNPLPTLIIKLYSLLLAIAVIVIMAIWFAGYKTNLPAPEARTPREFNAAILRAQPELFTTQDQPIYKIARTEKPLENWYILQLSPADSNGPDSTLIVNDPHFGSEYMKVVAGPESKFSRSELVQHHVPGSVINSLQKEGEL